MMMYSFIYHKHKLGCGYDTCAFLVTIQAFRNCNVDDAFMMLHIVMTSTGSSASVQCDKKIPITVVSKSSMHLNRFDIDVGKFIGSGAIGKACFDLILVWF